MTAVSQARAVPNSLSPKEIGLFLDVDGTLLDLAPRPEMVEVAVGLLADLAAAEQALDGALALVSGRPVAELDHLFAPLRLRASGIHGAEFRRHADDPVATQPRRLSEHAWRDLVHLLAEFPGSYAENKSVAFAVHYPDPGTDIACLEEGLTNFIARRGESEGPLRLLAGRAVFEVQLAGFDKGRAIARFMADEPFRGRMPVFIGDDEIDRAGFDKVRELGGLAFSVGIALPGVCGTFAGPDAVRAWLREFGR